jgi:hypothetical protein
LIKKPWLLPVIAGIALFASACANNAAPDYTSPNATTMNKSASQVGNNNGMGVRNAPGVAGTNNNNAFTNGQRPYNAFTDGTAGPANRAGMNQSIYRDRNAVGNGNGNLFGFGNGNGNNNGNFFGLGNGNGNGNNNNNGNLFGFGNGNGNGNNNGNFFGFGNGNGNRNGAGIMQTGMARMGYAQIDRNQMRTAGVDNVFVDRDALARAVGNVTASCPGVQRSTVLVTDEEVFVGLQTQGGDARTAKNQARMNAMSISPRYYKVYVTDNPNDVQEIARVASRSTNVQNARTDDGASVDTLIKRMGGMTDAEQIRGKGNGTNKGMNKANANVGTTNR